MYDTPQCVASFSGASNGSNATAEAVRPRCTRQLYIRTVRNGVLIGGNERVLFIATEGNKKSCGM